jgi:hypothetical protein
MALDAKKLLLLGGVGFLLYENWSKIAGMFGLSTSGVTIIPVNSSGPTQSGSTQPTTTTVNAVVRNTPIAPVLVIDNNPPTYNPANGPTPLSNLYGDLRRYVSTNPAYANGATYDQWNYAVRAVGGSIDAAIEDVFPGMDRGTVISLDQYWTGLNAVGLAGVRNSLSGLGQIFDSTDFLAYYDSNYMSINGKEYI